MTGLFAPCLLLGKQTTTSKQAKLALFLDNFMILIYALILLIALAWMLGRDLMAIEKRTFRGGLPALILIVILFILQATLVIYAPGQSRLQVVILGLSNVALIVALLLNHHLPGVKLMALGILLNFTVIIANGGWMPVETQMYHYVYPNRPPIETQARPQNSKNIILDREDINLWFLADIIPTPWLWRWYLVSLGDIILVAGGGQFIFSLPRRSVLST